VYSSPGASRGPRTPQDGAQCANVFAYIDAHQHKLAPLTEDCIALFTPMQLTRVARPTSTVLPTDGVFLSFKYEKDIGQYPLLLFPEGAARVTAGGDGWLGLAEAHAIKMDAKPPTDSDSDW
jgi:hypothetical protein